EPSLLIGCEEPELYQYPPQAQHLASVFEDLSEVDHTQVLVCTHSPYFVSGKGFPAIRLVRRDAAQYSTVSCTTFDAVARTLQEAGLTVGRTPTGMQARLNQLLRPQTNELFFAGIVILVEGIEDAAYLRAHLALTNQLTEFRRYHCHIITTEGKSQMPQLL